jgi:hypothetical protein
MISKYFLFEKNGIYSFMPNAVNYNEVLETSIDTVRKSVDLTKTFVKWDGTMPNCVINLTTKEGPYTYNEILVILATPEWTDPNPPMGGI